MKNKDNISSFPTYSWDEKLKSNESDSLLLPYELRPSPEKCEDPCVFSNKEVCVYSFNHSSFSPRTSEVSSLAKTDGMFSREGRVDPRERAGLLGGTIGYEICSISSCDERDDWDCAVRRRLVGRGAGVPEVLAARVRRGVGSDVREESV